MFTPEQNAALQTLIVPPKFYPEIAGHPAFTSSARLRDDFTPGERLAIVAAFTPGKVRKCDATFSNAWAILYRIFKPTTGGDSCRATQHDEIAAKIIEATGLPLEWIDTM